MAHIKLPSISTYNERQLIYRYSWLHLIRPLTFSGTISPVLAGTAFASIKSTFHLDIFFVMLIASLLVQASANMFNDYYDRKNGQDKEKWMEKNHPTLGNVPTHKIIPFIATITIGVAGVLGAWLSIQSTWWVAFIGTISILAGYGYSAGKKSFSALGLGELVAAVFLGFVTTTLAYIVQGGMIDYSLFLFATPYALIIACMILSNNIRDYKKDQGFRRTIALRLGRKNAFYLLNILLLTAYVWTLLIVLVAVVPWTALFSFCAIPVALKLRWSYRMGATRDEEMCGMKWAARHHWVFGMLYALGIWLGA